MSQKEIDFAYWEKRYGRSLNEVERLEIKNNLLRLLECVGQVYDDNPEYFRGFLDGIKRGREEMAKELTLPSPKP